MVDFIDFDMFFFFYRNMSKSKLSKELELEIVLLNGTDSIKKIEKLHISPKVLEKDNFHILTLALWCKNFDLVYYLANIKNYFLKASKDFYFNNSIKGLESFDKAMFFIYKDTLESLEDKKQMKKDIRKKPVSKRNKNILKF